MEQHSLTIDLFEYPGLFHVWVAVTMLPEAKHALERIVGLVDE